VEVGFVSFYSGTVLYDELARSGEGRFIWVSGDAWCLVYGDADASPKLAVFVEAVREDDVAARMARDRKAVRDAFFRLATAAGLPRLHVRFLVDSSLDRVWLVDDERVQEEIPLQELASQFARAGVPVSEGAAIKQINKQSSSSYHDWQRMALGGSITVSDLDLFRLDGDGNVIEVIEIKRSRIALDRWKPYAQDYDNFLLLGRFLAASGVPLTISYHLYSAGPPRKEDTRELTVWRVSVESRELVTALGQVDLATFVRGDYLA
jgi:hypothetical protein